MGGQRLRGGVATVNSCENSHISGKILDNPFIEILYVSYLRVWAQSSDMLTPCWWFSQ